MTVPSLTLGKPGRLVLAALLGLAALFFALPPEAEAERGVASRSQVLYVPATGQFLTGEFLAFYNRAGGAKILGNPITASMQEDGLTVQYTERFRLEFWPSRPDGQRVGLSLLGEMLHGPGPGIPREVVAAGFRWFPETRHSVGGDILRFYDANGGVNVFGLPIGEQFAENGRLVQHFQRATLEVDASRPAADRVVLRNLGDQYAREVRRLPASAFAPVPESATPPLVSATAWSTWSSWTTTINGYYTNKQVNMRISAEYMNGTILQPGEIFSFSSVLQANGYRPGLCQGGDGHYFVCEAGGACAGATAFYRAWFNAGMEILEVRNHSYESYPPLGWDATVYGGHLDLVVRNNTSTPVRILSTIDRAGNLTYTVQGRAPAPWTVERVGPIRQSTYGYRVGRRVMDGTGALVSEDWRTVNYLPPPAEFRFPEGWR